MGTLTMRFDAEVDYRLRQDLLAVGSWIRSAYPLFIDLHFHFSPVPAGETTAGPYRMQWRQYGQTGSAHVDYDPERMNGAESVRRHLIAATGRALHNASQLARALPQNERAAEAFGRQLLEAYEQGTLPPLA